MSLTPLSLCAPLGVHAFFRCVHAYTLRAVQGVVEGLFRHLDPDNDGQITFAEFTRAFIDLDLSQLIDLDLPVRRCVPQRHRFVNDYNQAMSSTTNTVRPVLPPPCSRFAHSIHVTQPAESKFKIKKKKPRPAAVEPGKALGLLRDAIRDRGSMYVHPCG